MCGMDLILQIKPNQSSWIFDQMFATAILRNWGIYMYYVFY